MKKFVLTVVSTSLTVLPTIGLAQPAVAPPVDVMQALTDITNWLFAILLAVAVIFLIIAGFYFITAQGDSDKVSKARMMVLWSLVGVAVAILARGLVMLVRQVLRA
jgi:membrane-associated HD superfamily phosphohydrolase